MFWARHKCGRTLWGQKRRKLGGKERRETEGEFIISVTDSDATFKTETGIEDNVPM